MCASSHLVTLLDADGLGEQTVHQITVILRLVSFIIRRQPQLNQLMVSHIVQTEEVGSRLPLSCCHKPSGHQDQCQEEADRCHVPDTREGRYAGRR